MSFCKHACSHARACTHTHPHSLICPLCVLQEVVQEMCRNHERPMLFPLSNPTSQAEITAEHAYEWSNGKCIFASGRDFWRWG